MTNRAVTTSIAERVWVTIRLGVLSVGVTVLLGIPFGIISAIKQKTALDYTVSILAVVLASIPGFWLALEGIVVFSIKLGVLPASGLSTPAHYVLPVLASGMMSLAGTTRIARSSLLEVIRQDYIRTARGQGPARNGHRAQARPQERADPRYHHDRRSGVHGHRRQRHH